jgi:hypothetical protein
MPINNIQTRLERLYERHGKTVEEGEKWSQELLDRSVAAGLPSRVGSLKYVEERMAKTIWPDAPFSAQEYRKNICHGFTSLEAKKRMNLKDKIWIYGAKRPEMVWHSVLTDQANNLVMDTFRSKGYFMGFDGYMLTDGEEGGDAEMLDLMACIPVGDLHSKYVTPILSSTMPNAQALAQDVKATLMKHGFEFGGSSVNSEGVVRMSTTTDESFDRFIEYVRPMGFTPMMRNRSGGGTCKKDLGNQRAILQYVPPYRVDVSVGLVTEAFLVGGEHDAENEIRIGDKLRIKHPELLQPTKDPRVDYLTAKNPGWTSWYFYMEGKCGAYVEMEKPQGFLFEELSKWLRTKKLLTPHSSATSLRGLGYPTFLYQMALKAGNILVTQQHTPAAFKLWEAIARKTGARILYVNPVARTVYEKPRMGDMILKVMMPATMVDKLFRNKKMAIKAMESAASPEKTKKIAELKKKISDATKMYNQFKKEAGGDKSNKYAMNKRDDIILLKRELQKLERHTL